MGSREELSFFDEEVTDPSADSLFVGAKSSAQYLVFSVSASDMAVALSCVLEIVPYERVSDVPGTPAFVRGVVHLRGRVIPVLDLAVKLGRTPQAPTKRTCILILELRRDDGRMPVGVVMDGLATLMEVDSATIVAAPKFSDRSDVRFVEGLVPTERGMLPLVDVHHLFGRDELAQVSSASRQEVSDPA